MRSSWENNQPWSTSVSTPTMKVLECLIWSKCPCNNITGDFMGQKSHFVLSPLPSSQEVKGSLEDPEKSRRVDIRHGTNWDPGQQLWAVSVSPSLKPASAWSLQLTGAERGNRATMGATGFGKQWANFSPKGADPRRCKQRWRETPQQLGRQPGKDGLTWWPWWPWWPWLTGRGIQVWWPGALSCSQTCLDANTGSSYQGH